MANSVLKTINRGWRHILPDSYKIRHVYQRCINPAYLMISKNRIHSHDSTNYYLTSSQASNDKSSRKWLQHSLLLMACGFGAFMIKRQSASCHHGEKNKTEKWKGMTIKLYQYQTCPFCSKTRFFLEAHNIPFENIEVHPIFKKEIKFAKSKKVPIVVIEKEGHTEFLQDSSFIISVLASYLINDNKSISDLVKLYPCVKQIQDDGKQKDVILNRHWLIHEETEVTNSSDKTDPRSEEAEWRMWADDYLVHIISPNVYRTFREAYQAFDHHVKQGRFNGTWEGVVAKYMGSIVMWLISKKLKKKYNLGEDVRVDLYKACNKWVDAIGKDRRFMGGDKPNLADISVFGVLSVMEGLDAFEDLLTHSKIKRWYFRTKKAIEEHDAQNLLLI